MSGKHSVMTVKRQGKMKMGADQINMDLFRNAGTACLIVAAAAFITALGMFFAFDIPSIFRIRTGPAAGAFPHTKSCSKGKRESTADFSFRIVRTIIITDTDESIDLQDLFG